MVTKKQLWDEISKLKAQVEVLTITYQQVLEATKTAAKPPTAEEVLSEWFNGAERRSDNG